MTIKTEENQINNSAVIGTIETFIKEFKIGSLLNRCNISKTKGASPLEIFTIVFTLSFIRKNIFEN